MCAWRTIYDTSLFLANDKQEFTINYIAFVTSE